MGKLIFWIVVFFLVLLALRLVSVHKTRNERRDADDENRDQLGKSGDTRRTRDDKPATDAMVKCGRCGVFTPKANAVMIRGGWACADASCAQKS